MPRLISVSTASSIEGIQALKIIPEVERKAKLRDNSILRQTDPDYIDFLLTTLKAAL